MASVRSGERASRFAMVCSLLSRYVRSYGAAAGELGLGIGGEADGQRAPATMSLLTGKDGEKGEARKETMELFPQNAGFGSDAAAVREEPHAREQEKHQLTIFYGGKVLVFDYFPADKAMDLMQMVGKGHSKAQNSGLLPSSTTAPVTDSTKVSTGMPTPASTLLGAQVNVQKPVRANAYDLPLARRASLHRFLEKKKDRLNAKAPYQVSPSDAAPVKKEFQESQPWLGLGTQAVNPNLSLSMERSQ